ncbi:MAG: LON peptidase substrate-binding domain-containing protein [Nitrospinae bacterium]|nr:LON peptidase substrate-binding domain-containing protein [Nitrospinota bacterium]
MTNPLQTGMTIPVFPLPTTVFYPGTPLPLHIFEPRYRQMTADALEGDRKIGMVLLRPNWEDSYFGKPQVYSVGCVGNIEKEVKHSDGKYNFTLVGLRRFRIISEKEGKAYRQAEIELLEEKNEQDIVEGQPNDCREKLIENFREFIGHIPEGNSQKKEPDWNLGTRLSEFVDRFAYQLDLSLEQKQNFLEEQDVLRRAEFLHSFLKMKIDLIHLSKKRSTHDARWN